MALDPRVDLLYAPQEVGHLLVVEADYFCQFFPLEDKAVVPSVLAIEVEAWPCEVAFFESPLKGLLARYYLHGALAFQLAVESVAFITVSLPVYLQSFDLSVRF